MRKKGGSLASKKIRSLLIISNLVLAVFAFAFVINEASVVSSVTTEGDGSGTLGVNADDTDASPLSQDFDALKARISKEAKVALNSPSKNLLPESYTLKETAYYEVNGINIEVDAITKSTENPNLYNVKLKNGQVFKATQEQLHNTKWNLEPELGRGEKPYTSSIFGNLGTGPWAFALDNILTGFQIAAAVVGVIQLLGGLFGLDSGLTSALSYGAFAGIMAGGGAYSLFSTNDALIGNIMEGGLWGATGIGIGIGLLVFALTYKDSNTQKVNFQCNTWSAPKGGADCEKCNFDSKNYPCTEYKCKSLGASCELLNPGTGEEKCAWVNERDVTSPIIMPNYENISSGYQYANVKIRPPGIGMEIKNLNTENNENGCIEAFFPLEFGVSTNEPTQCKTDYNHTQGFEDMQYFVGGSSTYKYNHTQRLSLPGPSNINKEFPELKNDGVYNLFVRCSDPNGNVNEDEFAVKFCVNPGPDTTPPKIEATSLINGMPVSYNTDSLNITVYTNEPADCKWSREDKDYGVMENTMQCARSVTEFNANLLYACSSKLTGIEDRKDNRYYFRCKDQPQAEESDRNVNEESYEFIVKGSQPLNIISVRPNGTIMGSTSIVSVNLEAETANGYKDGDAICYFSTTGNENDYVKFYETGGFMHRQKQDLQAGSYTYYFKCVDLGGNADYNRTKFKIEIDEKAPRVVRVRHDSGESSVCGAKGCLQITTDEESLCTYSITTCSFELNNGIKMPFDNTKLHYAEWSTDFNYYIKCADKSGNQPGPAQCSMTVKAYNKK